MNVVDQKAYVALSVPVSVFSSISSCSDGVLTRLELARDREQIVEAVHRGLSISSGSRAAFSSVLINFPASGNATETEEILIMVVARLPEGNDVVEFDWLHWSDDLDQLRLKATASQGRAAVWSQIVDLTQAASQYRFVTRPELVGYRWLKSRFDNFVAGSVFAQAFGAW